MASTRSTNTARDPRDTPAMRQYARFKAEHPDCVLFFRMGDFYEMFDEDARTVHDALGLTLTQRTEGIPMAGVPFHAVDGYLRRMLDQGFRVAVCDQVQDPSEAKGVVERAVTRVLTPGTLVDEGLLDDASNLTVFVLLDESADQAAIACAELSTGRFSVQSADLERVVDVVARLGPAELLVPDTDLDHERIADIARACACPVTPRPAWTLAAETASRLLCEHWSVHSTAGWGLPNGDPRIAVAGALLQCLLDTRPGQDGAHLAHLQPPTVIDDADTMHIDASTLRHLEIERTMRSGSTDGSLLDALQCCVTPMGRRLLRQWLCFPLAGRGAIEARHDMVASLLADDDARSDLRETVGRVQDLARIAGRAAMGRSTPRDLAALGHSIAQLPGLLERLELIPDTSALTDATGDLSEGLQPLGDDLRRTCVEDPPAHMRDGGLVRDGVDGELDDARLLQRDGAAWLTTYQAELAEQTGIPSLKTGYNRVFGYYIEVTHANVDRVPDDFVRKQTLKNAERYITDRLKTYESEVTSAQARAIAREQELFADLVDRVCEQADLLRQCAEVIAMIDVLCGFAEMARRHRLVRPHMTDGLDLDIRDGRHAVLDLRIGSDFVPNDCTSTSETGDVNRLLLITGPNMAGKSTYIRQVALIALMAQAGSFVPASSARLGVVDRLFARIGASDELHAGMSTFMVEMTETANILHNATDRSLVILDEIGRGTSTLDGLSLAWAITEALAQRGCRTLFATHYHELTDLADRIAGVGNRHVSVQEWQDRIVFLYRIEPGSTNRSYGVHVGRLAGLPEPVLHRARTILDSLAVHHGADDVPPTQTEVSHGEQLGLFAQRVDHPVVDTLRGLDLERLTPLEAFDALRSLRDAAQDDAS